MEQLLRGEEISEVVPMEGASLSEHAAVCDRAFDMAGPALFFPIRHHSPACAFHLKKVFEAYRPDCVLIEGPENAGGLIPALTDPAARAPMALYYFYRDTRGLLSKEKADYKCYYPFLNTSPELVALREAKARDIPARFVDLPYGEILLGTAEDRGIRKGEKPSYNDDYLLSRSRYLTLLCEKTGMKSFEEFWEKYFEIQGLFEETEVFVRQLLTYCGLSRAHTPKEELMRDGCLLREQYMAMKIAEASSRYGRLLVVTGGFHTAGLLELLSAADQKEPENGPGRFSYMGPPVRLHSLTDAEQGVYPLAYSMEAADALNGYASGMPSPGFYEQVWKWLSKTKEAEGAYQEAVLHQLTVAGRQARKKKESISSYDVICALSLAQGLAGLRGKREPGLYELRDGALSAFVKGERSLSTDLPLRLLEEINTGTQVGALPKDAPRPPILGDFEEQCRRFGLKIQAASEQTVTLELFTKKKHMELSRFLYQMDFLDTGFASRKKGADLVNQRDRSRVREIWSCRFSSHVLAVLTDVSMAGGTVREASRSRLISRSSGGQSAKEACRLLVWGFLMGFLTETENLEETAAEVIAEDGDFFSLAGGFSSLQMLYELQALYEVRAGSRLESLLSACFQKLIQLLPSMASVEKKQEEACMKSCLSLYQLTGRPGFLELRPILLDAFCLLLTRPEVRPGLEGAVMGLLYGGADGWEEKIQETAAGYLLGTKTMREKSAGFLRGLFYTAKDLIFLRESFFSMIDNLLERLETEEFLALLPELCMAFGYFTPLETDRLAARAAKLHGVSKKELLHGRPVSPQEYDYGESLDEWVCRAMKG